MPKAITRKKTSNNFVTGIIIEVMKCSVIMSPAAINEAVIETCRALIYVQRNYIKVRKSKNILLYKTFILTVGVLVENGNGASTGFKN